MLVNEQPSMMRDGLIELVTCEEITCVEVSGWIRGDFEKKKE